ncbi:MAG: DUF1570 domain-containing protein [Planctomycetes bacterium]|nr:DUF1570 domain-containing protein [Planctomycetota bacterium]
MALLVLFAFATAALAEDGVAAARARAALERGTPREAIAIADSALASNGGDPELLAVRGEARLRMGRTAEARADLESAARKLGRKVAGARARLEAIEGNDDDARKLLADTKDNGDRAVVLLLVDGPLEDVQPVRSERYVVFGEQGAQVALDDLERSRRAYEELLPPRPSKLVAHVYLFPSKADFTEFAGMVHEEVESDDAEGFSRDGEAFMAVHSGAKLQGESLGALVHEAFHLYVHAQAHGLPVWLDEGLAEYFGGVRLEKAGDLTFGHTSEPRHVEFRKILRFMKPLSVAAFVRLDEKAFHAEPRLGVNYAQAWAFAHFLLAKRPALLREHWKLMQEGRTPDEARVATFDREDAAVLQKEWEEFLAGL